MPGLADASAQHFEFAVPGLPRMLTVRLRTRDGSERLSVEEKGRVEDLRSAISDHIQRPAAQFVLSTDQALLTSKAPETFLDLADDDDELTSVGFKNGDWVYCYYDGAREVAPGYKRSKFDDKPFGVHMDVAALMAKQVRIARQDTPAIAAVSFDRFAAHAFQEYVQAALSFSVQRCGVLFGRVEAGEAAKAAEGASMALEGEDAASAPVVYVDAVYEPAQSGQAERLEVALTSSEAHQAEAVAASLGLRKVGFLFSQSAGEKEYIMNDAEVALACSVQADVGEHCVIAVFSQLEEDGMKEIHLEAYQCSEQAVELWKDGWFKEPAVDEVSGFSHFRNPHDASVKDPVMISGKDTDEVDNDFFLVPVAVKDHQSPLMTSFPVENRLTGQASNDLKDHLSKHSTKSYSQRLADFHLLLWLASNLHWADSDIAVIVDAVNRGQPLLDGYKMMIDSMAGL